MEQVHDVIELLDSDDEPGMDTGAAGSSRAGGESSSSFPDEGPCVQCACIMRGGSEQRHLKQDTQHLGSSYSLRSRTYSAGVSARRLARWKMWGMCCACIAVVVRYRLQCRGEAVISKRGPRLRGFQFSCGGHL